VETILYLMIRRKWKPYKDKLTFPGGFMESGKEDIFQTAVREFYEETAVCIEKDQISLLDIRSSSFRDPHGHVIDIGFLSVVPKPIVNLESTNETWPVWVIIDEISQDDLAFDHKGMLEVVKFRIKKMYI
jgi:ADP-ribose pyrophosphatase YjhB (NUDIX family)